MEKLLSHLIEKYPIISTWYGFIIKNQDWMIQICVITSVIITAMFFVFSSKIGLNIITRIRKLKNPRKKNTGYTAIIRRNAFEFVAIFLLFSSILFLESWEYRVNLINFTIQIFVASIISEWLSIFLHRSIKHITFLTLFISFLANSSDYSPLKTANLSQIIIFDTFSLKNLINLFLLIIAITISYRNIISLVSKKIDVLNIEPHLKTIFKKTTSILLAIFCFILIIKVIDVNPKILTVFTGAFGIGIGLGMQKIAASFIDGISILFESNIKIGDWIEISSEIMGNVEKISIKSVLIRKTDGSTIIVPIENVSSANVINRSKHGKLGRAFVKFNIKNTSNLNKAIKIVEDITNDYSDTNTKEHNSVIVDEASIHGIVIIGRFWLSDYSETVIEKESNARIDIINEFKKHDIELYEYH